MVSGTPAPPPGVLSLHALPADHHDGPWDQRLEVANDPGRLTAGDLLAATAPGRWAP